MNDKLYRGSWPETTDFLENLNITIQDNLGSSPIAGDDMFTKEPNQRHIIDVLANDSDPDMDHFFIQSVSEKPGFSPTQGARSVQPF